MVEEIPVGLGPPPHRHDWDEAYYVVEGALDFEIEGKPVRVESGGFTPFGYAAWQFSARY
jgi:mannose-6-phosphate isomerase-like protein (cupin superfamily)